jgi:sulfoxide reductase heme-binding subunit YedZ
VAERSSLTGALWYADRAAGITALVLLTISVCLGMGLAGRARSRRWPAFAIEDVHRYLGLLTGGFIGIHALTILLDSYVPYSLTQLLVPGTAPSRTMAVAAGVVSAELLIALAVTNRFRKSLSFAFWRKAHYLNFAVWILALGHGIAAGTDSDQRWAVFLYAACAAAVAGLLAWRVLAKRALESWEMSVWPTVTAIVVGELVVALTYGPLGHHA